MKAIIPAAGIGSRLRPHTHTQPKSILPVAGKAILGHIIDHLVDGGIRDFVIVIGYMGYKVEAYVQQHYGNTNLNFQFVHQITREGIAHAVWFTRECVEGEKDLLIVLGDSILQFDLKRILQSNKSFVGVKKVDKPGNFGVAEVDPNGKVKKLVEKPKIPKSNLALVGIYKISQPESLFESLLEMMGNGEKNQGEYQLTDALMKMVTKGNEIYILPIEHWYDCGKKDSLLAANHILLKEMKVDSPTLYDFPDTIIIPPVSIGIGCKIKNSIIGPNVALGEHANVSSSIISESIIGSFSEIKNSVLERSIIGNDSSLSGFQQSLNIGDNTEINLNPLGH
jgi:glucose-1-phosphate thymidylyltransferase